MHRIFKLVARITSVIFIGMLLYVYAFLPNMVGLYFDANGKAVFEVDRQTLFYGSLSVFVLYTLILSFLKKSLKSIPITDETGSMPERKKQSLQIWSDGLSVVLNLFFTFTVTFVGLYHNDEHFNLSYFSFLVYLGPILLVGWIFYLIYILFSKP